MEGRSLLKPMYDRTPSHSTNGLHLIALALRMYRQDKGCFPPAFVADSSGKPLHSWRTLILPYLDMSALYQAYDFAEP